MRHIKPSLGVPLGFVNAVSYGAVGVEFSTIGTIAAGSTQLTLTGALLPTGVKAGSGIGIAGAGPTDSLSSHWFPTPTLRARVVSVSGNQVELDTPAAVGVVGAAVYVDDGLPIQTALDVNVGGGVYVPVGTFVIGAPGAKNNQPLYIPPGTFLVGAGQDLTTIKVCNRACQISIGLQSNDSFAGLPQFSFFYPHASVIVNKGNQFWHGGLPFPHQNNAGPYVPDVGGGISSLALDGNMYNQVAASPGNRTGYVLPDPRGFMQVDTQALVGAPPSDRLQNNHLYYVAMTYADAQGRETADGPAFANAQIPNSGNYQLSLLCRTPPPGAVNAILYVIDYTAANVGAAGWVWNDPVSGATPQSLGVAESLKVWTRIDLGRVPAASEQVIVNSYTPAAANLETRPPGGNYSQRLLGYAASTAQYGVFLDNADGFSVKKTKIKDCMLDGITLGSAEFGFTTLPLHDVQNCLIEDVSIDNCGREALGVTGSAHGNTWRRVTTTHVDWAMDFEVDSGSGSLDDNTFEDCVFHGGQFIVATFEGTPGRRFKFKGVLFDKAVWTQNGAGEMSAHFSDCTWLDTYGVAVSARGGNARLYFLNPAFTRCGKFHPPSPDHNSGDQPDGFLRLSNNGEAPGPHFTHAVICGGTMQQIDQIGGQVAITEYLGCYLDINGLAVQTQTQAAAFLVGGRAYVLDDVTGNYSVLAGP